MPLSSSSSSSSSSASIPAPEPPRVLPDEHSQLGFRHAFLNPTPAHDSTMEVSTFQFEYQLLVKLPGFHRDAITLATNRKRVLHVVADRWDNGGGHFERRVAFGYDADLSQVKADFDGEMLRISIPRRTVVVGSIHPVGRSS